MAETKITREMKVVIPVAGAGTRLRPHTYTQPKPLMPVAGKPIICFIIDKFVEIGLTDFVIVIGYLGEKIRDFLKARYPYLNMEFVLQEKREGSGHAIWTARENIKNEDEIFIAFGDTIFDADLREMMNCKHSCLSVKRVNVPRDFGVVEFDSENHVTKLVEKPLIPKSNMAIVGLYKIREIGQFIKSAQHLIESNSRTVGEIQLTDCLQNMVENGVVFEAMKVNNWYDCGRKDVLLETNAMLLNQVGYATDAFNLPEYENTIIIHPVAIGENCTIANSIIGPHVTIGNNADIQRTIVQNSIIGSFASLNNVVLRQSVIGSDASVRGADLSLNIGDNTEIDFD